MKNVRLAVIGLGNMGSSHCKDISGMTEAQLYAVCDIDRAKADTIAREYDCNGYYSTQELFNAGNIDGVIIATPHYDHTPIAIEAFSHGIHVLTEKPVGVHVNDIQRMISAWERTGKGKDPLVFAAMFQQRTRAAAMKIKEMIDSGELGTLIRMTWIITDWYRTQRYYDSGGWRATWAGEGGGVLMNQCPHQLDLFQWFAGRPDRVRGFASFGKYHDIEVEDEVTAYFEYDSGMVGHFITSTGESPGTNRLEIVGEQGKLVWEGDSLTFFRNRVSILKHLKTAEKGFENPECWTCTIPVGTGGGFHRRIIENFCQTILGNETLIAPATEGIHSIAMANAITASSLENRMMDVPVDGDLFEAHLKKLISSSNYVKRTVDTVDEDFKNSF